jgi:peptidoglycan/LPS O-acetylase OafA/YrhL
LGVEEQFYFIWPAVVIFTPKNFLNGIFVFFILISLVCKIYLNYVDPDKLNAILLISCIYKFSLGASSIYIVNFLKMKTKFTYYFFEIALLFLISIYIGISFFNPPLIWLCWDVLIFLCFIALLHLTFNEVNSFTSSVLSNNVMVYLGTISYGIYLYHSIIPWALGNLINKFDLIILGGFVREIANVIAVIIVSHISYYFFERYFLKFKDNVSKK